MAENLTADVILVVVSDERTDDFDPVLGGDIDQALHIPSGVDDIGLAGFAAADEIGEVRHFADGLLCKVEVAGCGHQNFLSNGRTQVKG